MSDTDFFLADSVRVTREITREECPWLDENIPAGTILDVASDPYGVVSSSGLPVWSESGTSYVEVPRNAVSPAV